MPEKKKLKYITQVVHYEDGTKDETVIYREKGTTGRTGWEWVPTPNETGQWTWPNEYSPNVFPYIPWKNVYDLNDIYSLLYSIWQTLIQMKMELERIGQREKESTSTQD